jgi:hypothetical protein
MAQVSRVRLEELRCKREMGVNGKPHVIHALYTNWTFADRVEARSEPPTIPTMAVTKGEEKGESSTSAAKKVLKANTNGIANYELPW